MTRRNLLISMFMLALANVGAIALLHLYGPAEHGHGQHGMSELALNDGMRWATDAPLRQGLERIRDGVAPIVAASTARPLTMDEATALSSAIKDQVQFLVENCKLEPRADAALHVLLNDFLQGADALAADPASKAGLEYVVNALNLYPQYFDHHGWRPLAEGPK
jgi:hypothetical protein